MKRRTWFAAAGVVFAGLGAAARASAAPPGYRVSLRQLQEALAQRFPLRYPVPGLFDVSVGLPQLQLLAQLDRLGAALPLQVAGPALRRGYSGQVDLDFQLRYEAADRTIRAHRLRVEAVRFDGLTGQAQALIERAASEFAQQSLLEVVLHRLRPQDLALTDAMGLQPGAIDVTEDGIVVQFVNQPPR